MDSRRVLLVLDGSQASFQAAARLDEFLDKESLDIDLLCVTNGQQNVEPIFAEASAALVRQGLVSRQQITAVGNPVDEILRCASETNADVIVLGGHRQSTLEHLLRGDVAGSVADRAPCPVLIVAGWDETLKEAA
jgi:nucleotide-binding universal stress UspA family protein